jgi:8-oxo-dGTP pyrophosphatase MutT (NUDIX family)
VADRRGGTKGKGRAKRGGAKRGGSKRASDRARSPKIPTTREVSAGGVVYRRAEEGIEVVLASRRTRKGQLAWGLAKGGIELGETKEAAAIREVREETGMTAEIEADLGDTRYMYVWDEIRIRKTVHFFLMRHTGGDVDDRDDEMEEIRWFPLERAIKRAAYRGERDMLVKASELLR